MRSSFAFSLLLIFYCFTTIKAQIVELRCDFILYGCPYTCILFGVNFPDRPTMFVFTGPHGPDDQLEKVHISVSNAPFIIRDFFNRFDNLVDFQIVDGGLKRIVQGDFGHAFRLRSLTISENPDLKTIPRLAFSGPWDLLSIQLHSNSIEDIHEHAFAFQNNPLEALNLNNNNISHLPSNLFIHLTRLRRFFIADNKLKTIDGRLLIDARSLSAMDFRRNKINALERFSNRFIQMLRMEGNLCIDASWINQAGIANDLIRQGLATCFDNFDEIPEGQKTEFIIKLRGSMVIRYENGTEIVRIPLI